MMQETAVIGATRFPLVAGAASSSLTDPVALGLADYFAHWLNTSLNPQLAVMAPHGAQAVPAANIHANDPGGNWVRRPTPALYVWWQRTTKRAYSTLRDMAVETYGFLLVADEQIVAPDGLKHFEGFTVAASRVLRLAEDRGYHATYGYNGAEDGTPIGVSLDIAWSFARLEHGEMSPVQATSANAGGTAEGGIQRYYPAVQGEIEVLAIAGQQIPRDPEDLMGDIRATIGTNESGDVADPLDFMERILPGPDGSENP